MRFQMKSPCWKSCTKNLRRLWCFVFWHGPYKRTGHTFQSLKSLFRCVIVPYVCPLHLRRCCNMQTPTHIACERPWHTWALREGVPDVGPVPGFRHAGELLVEEPTSPHQRPSFFCVTNRLTDGFSATTFCLPRVQRSITVGDWRALKNGLSSCFFVTAELLPAETLNREQNSRFITGVSPLKQKDLQHRSLLQLTPFYQ